MIRGAMGHDLWTAILPGDQGGMAGPACNHDPGRMCRVHEKEELVVGFGVLGEENLAVERCGLPRVGARRVDALVAVQPGADHDPGLV